MTPLTDPAERARSWRKVSFFFLLTLALSSVFYLLIVRAGALRGSEGLYVTGLTWCPAVAAFVTQAAFRDDWRSFGWDWAHWRWQWRGYWIPIAYALPIYLLVWSTGLGYFDLATFASKKAADFGWSLQSHWLVLLSYVLLAGSAGLIIFGARCLGEEIGWRGFLVPELAKVTGFRGVAIISGLMWAAWHFPVLLFADYNSGAPAWFSLLCFTSLVMGISVVMAWLRLASGSLWPAVIAHAVHNRLIQTVLTPLTADAGQTNIYIDEFGIGLALTGLLAGAWAWRKAAAQTALGAP